MIRRTPLRVCGARLRVIAPSDCTPPFAEMSQRWRAVGNTVSDLTGPKFEPQTCGSGAERVTARPTGRNNLIVIAKIFIESILYFPNKSF